MLVRIDTVEVRDTAGSPVEILVPNQLDRHGFTQLRLARDDLERLLLAVRVYLDVP